MPIWIKDTAIIGQSTLSCNIIRFAATLALISNITMISRFGVTRMGRAEIVNKDITHPCVKVYGKASITEIEIQYRSKFIKN